MAVDLVNKVNRLQVFDNKNWDFTFSATGQGEGAGAETPQYLDFKARVQSVSAPFFDLVTESKNTGRKYVTTFSAIPNVTITFIESPDLKVQNYLVGWKESIFKSDLSLFVDSKFFLNKKKVPWEKSWAFRTGYLNIYLPEGKKKTLKFSEMRVVRISPVTFDYDDKVMIIEAEFIISQIGGYHEGFVVSN